MSPKGKRALKILAASVLVLVIIALLLAYLYQRDLRKRLAGMIAAKSSALIGQRVDIRDLSVSKGRVDLYNISVRNPEGFEPGNLLSIDRLSMDIELSDLMSGRFEFRQIVISSPELTVVRDSKGRFNISDKLMAFLRKKPSLKYRVEELRLESGRVLYKGSLPSPITPRAAVSLSGISAVSLRIRPLSSDPGVKTTISGSMSYLGGKIDVDGWAYLKDDPRKFAINVSSEDLRLEAFREMLERYRIDAGKSTLAVRLSAESDKGDSVNFTGSLGVKDLGVPYVKGGFRTASMKSAGSLDLNAGSLIVKDFSLDADNVLAVSAKAVVKNLRKSPSYNGELKIRRLDLSALQLPQEMGVSGVVSADKVTIAGRSVKSLPALSGGLSVREVSVSRAKKTLIQKVSLDSKVIFDGNSADLRVHARAGKILLTLDGKASDVLRNSRKFHIKMVFPEARLADIRDAFWDIFPDRLLYAGLDGSLAADAAVDYDGGDMRVNGSLAMKGLGLTGENNEFFVGPVDGTLPIVFQKEKRETRPAPSIQFPVFSKAEFNNLRDSFSKAAACEGCSRITIGSAGYGFRLLENVEIQLKQEGSVLNIKRFSGNISGGKISGAALMDFSKGIGYRAGFVLDGLSLKKFCDSIEPIKGYISGKVDGVAALKGDGTGLSNLIGKADFWTFGTSGEQTKISKDFLRKIGGPALKTYLGDRRFDKGVVSLYLQDGFIIFDQLEISHKNLLGMTDLSVKVAPYNNRIAIDHLMWTITEAAQRAKKEKE